MLSNNQNMATERNKAFELLQQIRRDDPDFDANKALDLVIGDFLSGRDALGAVEHISIELGYSQETEED